MAILKQMHNMSDEEVLLRWGREALLSALLGEEFIRHVSPFNRSSMTRWRQRVGAERQEVLLQENLAVAVKTEALDVKDLAKVVVDTPVREKALTVPTDAKLMNRARETLVPEPPRGC